jgi:predicted transcriptional regulator
MTSIVPVNQLSPLTPGERRYLRALRDFEKKNVEFTHRKVCQQFGWKSVQASFDFMRRLIKKGYIDQHGQRLALVVCPVVTEQGKQAITKRAA